MAVIGYVFRFWLALRHLLPKQKCRAFAARGVQKGPTIEKIYVINLDREPGRWFKMKQELMRILDSSGAQVLEITDRHVATDGKQFSRNPFKDAEIDPIYTLADQLFVEPQPLSLPTQIELDAPIRMSRAEVAVAQSHINIWKKIAYGDQEYVLILEDDTWFNFKFSQYLDQAWSEIVTENDGNSKFDILYVSYLEVKHGAPKTNLSENIFRPVRGLWHLSGYVLSREGAVKLLGLLPCRGPIDLWINHHFEVLNVLATKKSLIGQRRDIKSSNSYSILPSLTKIGAINSEGASLFNIRPIEEPVFAFGPEGTGLSSLAMALSMLGYKCCSDFDNLPSPEMMRLLEGKKDRIFNAYVNIGSLTSKISILRNRYPKAKFIITTGNSIPIDSCASISDDDLKGADIAVLHLNELKKWQVICKHLRCAPPTCSFPALEDYGQRSIIEENKAEKGLKCKISKQDNSPWLVENRGWWKGFNVSSAKDRQGRNGTLIKINDRLKSLNTQHWLLRSDTFNDNLALFRPSNVEFSSENGAVFSIKESPLGVRDYSGASLCSVDQYLFGKFEAVVQASNVPGVVTGIFLHRNSPRQEIDIEITGNRSDQLIVNVFYNPGDEGANFDYGYRGTPTYIELGFDASKGCHRYGIEWTQNEIRWFVDDKLIHKRVIWNPTPIPNLPMTFHVNSWLTRSTQLAGRINNRLFPATTIVSELALEANSVLTSSQTEDRQHPKYKSENINLNHPTQ
jgi:GR25 family glycosyltransferase involved in LPS biosynthesis